MEEYFERDVKSEFVSDMELDRPKELKHEFKSDDHKDKDDMLKEYFEKDVKSGDESDVELD